MIHKECGDTLFGLDGKKFMCHTLYLQMTLLFFYRIAESTTFSVRQPMQKFCAMFAKRMMRVRVS